MADVELVVVETFDSQPEADLAKGLLEAAGIEAIIQADTAGGMRPHLAMVGSGFRLLVRTEDATSARDVLDARLKSSDHEDIPDQ